ncbi:hypothetical protein [Ructibacterium gallinarum]|uniref:Uncharacterized protein n=1 Tax=Ructibacterium gallinarum TaxID=2779355 RepID=A0A9D5R8T2_9FIRM|nr:hypothetical protein [Ructibacterium gallinarum]MBE5040751.1 hypothetical protein [Ructibacterium gallinarum]
MKIKYWNVMAVLVAAIFILSGIPVSAEWSNRHADKDYRMMEILNKDGVVINKPTAQFAAKRVVNGEVADSVISDAGYDCAAAFPTLTCYVGDTLTFEDLSRDNNQGGSIVEWDWQRSGSLGDAYAIYDYNIVNNTSIYLDSPGETIFYLCVRNNVKVKTGCCDPWSENGSHQTIGTNKWFPKGAYWYFSAVRVVVKPMREAMVFVRWWDAQNNRIFHEGYVNAGQILQDADTVETSFHIDDWEGYLYSGWNVQLMDGIIQYSGTERDVGITLAGWVPEKYLNIEFYPYMATGVEVRYWDTAENTILKTELLTGEKVVKEQETTITAALTPPSGYTIKGWNVQFIDGAIQYTGTDNPVDVILNGYIPTKYLNVECSRNSGTQMIPGGGMGTGETSENENLPDPTVSIKPNGVCNGIIEWTETDSHRVPDGYTSKGKRKYRTCTHTFEYKAALTADAVITPDTLKSGYGFEVGVSCSLETTLVSNKGGCSGWGANRRALMTVKDPAKATVYLPWNMTNRLGTQSKTIGMEPNGKLKFQLPVSNVSEAGARKIYTPVELPGTEEEPVNHEFEIYISGGGIEGVEFCQKLIGRITVNGDMYSDDFSGAD